MTVNVMFPVVELLDRLIISKIKIEKNIDSQLEFDFYNSQAQKFNLELVKPHMEKMEKIHKEIWNLESHLKNGAEAQISLDEIGRRAIAIRDLNNQRIKLKNAMAEILNCPIREIKKDHLSE